MDELTTQSEITFPERVPPKTVFAGAIQEGDSFDDVFVLGSVEVKKTKAGKPYWKVRLTDRTSGVEGKIWSNANYDGSIPRGSFVKIRADATTFKDEIDLNIKKIRLVKPEEGVAIEDFVRVGPRDRFQQMTKLRALVENDVRDPALRALSLYIFDDPGTHQAFRDAPAAQVKHQPYVGGLIEHVSSMFEIGVFLTRHYRNLGVEVDADLILTAVLYHDIGKTRELEWGTEIKYSVEGALVGHIAIGLEILDRLKSFYLQSVEICSPADLDKANERWTHLRHVIASHHGRPDWGAIRPPMTREAQLFHLIDMIDSNVNWDIWDDEPDAEGFMKWQSILGGRAWRSTL